MMEVIKDSEGNLKACIEWLIYNSKGELDDFGDGVFIGELYINPKDRGNGILKEFMKIIIHKCANKDNLRGCFFFRETKYKGRGPRFYSKERWLKLIGE
jgi:hypothetical protein